MKPSIWPIIIVFIAGSIIGTTIREANAAVYCYPHGMNTVCFSDGDRRSSSDSVKTPNVIIPYHPYVPNWAYGLQQQPAYRGDTRNQVPEQDFSECTLALGCIKGTR